jgi:hypothetical protein
MKLAVAEVLMNSKGNCHEVQLKNALALCLTLIAIMCGASFTGNYFAVPAVAQQNFPAPPADRALIYVADEKNNLTPLPFEAGTTPLKVDQAAKSDKTSYVELKGAQAATVVSSDTPRFYLFLPDQPNVRSTLLVRLEVKKNARRVAVMSQKGLTGFSIASDEIVKPRIKVLGREGGMQYIEISPREGLLAPGEYAFIGTHLSRLATFRVTQ